MLGLSSRKRGGGPKELMVTQSRLTWDKNYWSDWYPQGQTQQHKVQHLLPQGARLCYYDDGNFWIWVTSWPRGKSVTNNSWWEQVWWRVQAGKRKTVFNFNDEHSFKKVPQFATWFVQGQWKFSEWENTLSVPVLFLGANNAFRPTANALQVYGCAMITMQSINLSLNKHKAIPTDISIFLILHWSLVNI